MSLRRNFKYLFRRRDYDYEQGGNKVIESVESGCFRATKTILSFFQKHKDIQFERSSAPSPEPISGQAPHEEPREAPKSTNIIPTQILIDFSEPGDQDHVHADTDQNIDFSYA